MLFYIEFDEFETYNHYDRLRIPLPEPSSKDYGAYLRQMRAAAALRAGGDRMPSRQSQRGDYYGIFILLNNPDKLFYVKLCFIRRRTKCPSSWTRCALY